MIKVLLNFLTIKADKIIILSAVVFLAFGCSASNIRSSVQPDFKETEKKKNIIIPEGNSYFNYVLSELEKNRRNTGKSFEYLIKAQQKAPHSKYLKKKLAGNLLLYKKTEAAKKIIAGLIEQTPEDTEVLAIQAGILALEQQNPEKIAEIYKKILELDPDNQKAPIALAFLYEKMNKRNDLIELFEKAEKNSKHNYFLYFYLGEAYLLEKNYSKAKQALYKAVQEEPYRVEPKLSLIETLKNLETTSKNKEEIINLFNEIIELKPEEISPLIELSFFFNQNGDYEKSDEAFRPVAEQWISDKKQTAALLNFYIKNGSEDIADFTAMRIFQATGDSSVFMVLAGFYRKEKLNDKALKTYKLVPETSEMHSDALAASALTLAFQGQTDKGISLLEKNLHNNPQDLVLLSALGNLYEEKKDYKAAESVYLKAASIKSEKQWSFFYRLGVTSDKAGKKEKAVEYMKKALELDSENPDTLNYLGYTYAELGIKLETAKMMIEKALSLKKDNGYIIDSLGWVYFKMGDYKKAEQYLKKAGELVKDDPVILEHLAELYSVTDRLEQAIEVYNKILALDPENKDIKNKLNDIKKQ
jgi:tetratricopeptide (TPR) repeat protein